MIGFLIGVAATVTVVNLLFFFVGYFAGKGTLQDKVKEIIKARDRIGTTGVVTPLEPRELDKKRSRDIEDKYMK